MVEVFGAAVGSSLESGEDAGFCPGFSQAKQKQISRKGSKKGRMEILFLVVYFSGGP